LTGCPVLDVDACKEIVCIYTDASADVDVDAAVPVDAPVGDGGGVDVLPGCDVAKSPSDEPCLVSEKYGVFVAPDGVDTNGGTKTAPVKTLAHALEVAAGRNVYVCNGKYEETLSIQGSTSDVGVFGGFTCPGASDGGAAWAYVAGTRATVKVATPTYALRIANTSKRVRVEDVAFEVADATAPGAASVAGFVSDSTDVTLRRVSLKAGHGGAPGAAGQTPTAALPVATKGTDGASGGTAVTCPCANGVSSVGGKGGTNLGNGDTGAPNPGGGVGGDATKACQLGGKGGGGAGAMNASAANASAVIGSVSSLGWASASGPIGDRGATGQGGGGGASADATGIGGGGACGGCGGEPSSGGAGGGSSIGLLVLQSKVTIVESNLVTGDASNGGVGVVGQAGATGATGGLPGGGGGCSGGVGGKGGDGAASGGGAGGSSVGVVWNGGTAPNVDTATQNAFTHGAAGTGGVGGAPGINDGPKGVAQAVLGL
jgi:hypothetical protein